MRAQDLADIYLLTPTQQGMLAHGLKAGSGVYHCQSAYQLDGPLDPQVFGAAVATLVQRHQTLRTAFIWEGIEQPHQAVLRQATLTPLFMDWSACDSATCERDWEALVAEQGRLGFDLARPPLMRMHLVRIAPERHRLLWTAHHLILDGWSAALCLGELLASMRGTAAATSAPQFKQYVQWQAQQRAEAAEAQYWRTALAGYLPQRSFVAQLPGRGVGRLACTLEPAVYEGLKGLARACHVTLNHVVQLLWLMSVHRATGQHDVVAGLTVSGRPATLAGASAMVGPLLAALPVRMRFNRLFGLQDALSEIKQQAVEAAGMAHVPATEMKRHAGIDTDGELFESLVIFENYPTPQQQPGDPLQITPLDFWQFTHYPLALLAGEGESLSLELQYHAAAVPAALSERLFDLLRSAAARLARATPLDILAELDVITVAPPARDDPLYHEQRHVVELFATAAATWPQRVCLVDGEYQLRYAELDALTDRIAAGLVEYGVRRGEVILLGMDRSRHAIVAMLAILKAGAAYLPLDRQTPEARFRAIVGEHAVRVAFADPAWRCHAGWDEIGQVIDPRDPAVSTGRGRLPVLCGHDLAYVMYTSGSTGRPKGVAVPHRGIVRLVRSEDYLDYSAGLAIGQATNLAFDVSVYEIWGTLLNGGRMHIIGNDTLLSPALLQAQLRAERIDTLWLTAGLFNSLVESDPGCVAGLRHLLVGGDVVSPVLTRRVQSHCPGIQFINGYGPTENTTFSCCHRLPADWLHDDSLPVPIGVAIGGSSALVLDAYLTPCVAGMEGELYVGGAGLAWGYWGRGDLTAERFVPHPWATGERLYRTGDVVRLRDDGVLEFLGRRDNQIKLRGYRVELAEVEAGFQRNPMVEAVCVQVWHAEGRPQLVAYCQVRGAVGAAALRLHAATELPGYMVPAVIIVLDQMPLNPNGKIDRQRLPAPTAADCAPDEVATGTATEQAVAALWRQVLAVGSVGPRQNFFALGGDSLLAVRLLGLIGKQFRCRIPFAVFFRQPEVYAMAAFLDQAARDADLAEGLPDGAEVPLQLSAQQREFWMAERLSHTGGVYNVAQAWRVQGALDYARLQAGWRALLHRHEVLRTGVQEIDGVPCAVLHQTSMPVQMIDLGDVPAAQRVPLALERATAEQRVQFDLGRGDCARLGIIRLSDDQHLLMLTLHHIAVDGVSMELLLDELGRLYEHAAALPPPVYQYRHFAHWQQQLLEGGVNARLAELRDYWRSRLDGLAEIGGFPPDFPRTRRPGNEGAVHIHHIDGVVVARLRALASACGASLFTVVSGALALTAGRTGRQPDVVIATSVANRPLSAFDAVAGCFVNTLPVRLHVGRALTVRQFLDQVRSAFAADLDHQSLPYGDIAALCEAPREPFQGGLRRLMLSFSEREAGVPHLAGARAEPWTVPHTTARTDLTVDVAAQQDGLVVRWEYATALFAPSSVAAFGSSLEAVLQQFSSQWDAQLDSIGLQVAALLPASDHAFDDDLWSVFSREAARNPDAPALDGAEGPLSYRELHARAEHWAGLMYQAGVRSGGRVALHGARCSELVAVMLGTIRLGALYLPLDIKAPFTRQQEILEDADVQLVVAAQDVVLTPAVRHLALGARGAMPSPAPAPHYAPHAGRPAYMMYTSGSTGKPKGVLVHHGGIVRLVQRQREIAGGPLVRTALQSNLAFDASTFELWMALLNGGCCVIGKEGVAEGWLVRELIERHRVNVLFLTTALFNTLVDVEPECLRGLHCLLFGGESASADHVRQLLQAQPGLRLVHAYGPTENTVFSTLRVLGSVADIAHGVPIGGAIEASSCTVVDRALQPLPAGIAGELLVGGAGVALGYWRRPDLTAERFIPDPAAHGARRYRTGDLVRDSGGGVLHYSGREDGQVKLRGFRIELGEIEQTLIRCTGLRNIAVVLAGEGAGRHLVMFWPESEGATDVDELRRQARAALPEYMVPERYIPVAALPLNANGKRDLRHLLGLAATALPSVPELGAVALDANGQKLLSELAPLLPGQPLAPDDDFFAVGGNSLTAVRIQALIASVYGVRITLEDIFLHSSCRELAGWLAAHAATAAPVLPQQAMMEGEL